MAPYLRGTRLPLMGREEIKYRLRDEFATAKSAPMATPRNCEPGPGVCNIVDVSGTKVSISAGALRIVGNGTIGQSGFYMTPAIVRAAGVTVRFPLNRPTINWGTFFGFTIAIPTLSVANFANVGLTPQGDDTMGARRTTSGLSPTIINGLSAAVEYPLWQVLRLSGRFVFMKIGGIIKLLWFDEWDSTADLYIAAELRFATESIAIDSIRCPVLVYVVLADASDSFNRADGAMGSTDGKGHTEANSGSGKAWTANLGTWAVASNVAACSALAGGIGIATVDTGKADEVVRVETTRSGNNIGLVVRYVDANNYIYAYTDGTNATIRKVLAGVDSQVLAPAAITYAAGAKFMISCDATKIWLFYNELLVGIGTVSDAALQTGTKHGLYTTNTGNTFNNMVALPRNGYSELDRY